jgi:hypothetical protein
VRYRIETAAGDPADYCHCRQCRQATGAPVAAWVQVLPDRFERLAGAASGYASSADCTRWFCGRCGSPLYMTDESGRSVGVLLASLDSPETVRPSLHGWFGARIAWFDTADDLPRHVATPPYDL